MKKFTSLSVLLCFLMFNLTLEAQQPDQRFKKEGINQRVLELNRSFTYSEEIFPFSNNGHRIYGLDISANIRMTDSDGVVRIVFVDSNFEEHLIYETYALLDDATELSVEDFCEETAILNGLKPHSIKVEITGAEVELKRLSYSSQVTEGLRIARLQMERKLEQDNEKIRKINENLQAKNLGWVAGHTGVSMLTYSRKKELFGQSTFPAGFEYYVGGVISTGTEEDEETMLKSASSGMMVDNWDWRNRHGQNWVTPVKDQRSCGSCWAFSSTGAVEALVNLYFNQLLNLDLSEQELLSCSGSGDCNGGFPGTALDYVTKTGIVDEATFPYANKNGVCSSKGSNPNELIKIGGRVDFTLGKGKTQSTEDDLKRMIIELGPINGGLYDWMHTMVLVGYQVVKEGDKFFYRDPNGKRAWNTVSSGDPLIGKTVWIFKNSWGTSFGDEGYVYVETPLSNFRWTHGLKTPVVSLVNDYEVICEDKDGDGYYWWGLGEKPESCDCPDEPDGDDSDPTLGPLDEYGNCRILSPAPVANFSSSTTSVYQGEAVAFTDLSSGNPVSWKWVFEGGTPATSNLQNPEVKYEYHGTYKVSLTVTNSDGSATKSVEDMINVDIKTQDSEPVILAPVAEFSANETVVKVGESIQFADLSENEPTQWQWEFPGGTPASSTEKNPVVRYDQAGEHDVILVVSKTGFDPSEKIQRKYITSVADAPADYCIPVSVNSSGDYIKNVTLGNLLNNTTTGNGYSWFPSAVSLVPGQKYSISLTPRVITNRSFWRVWIDVNGDGDFDDSGETLAVLNNKKGTVHSTITIPANAAGTTRMRVIMSNSKSPSSCDDNFSGEVEDYEVSFVPAAPYLRGAELSVSEKMTGTGAGSISLYPNPVEHTLSLQLDLPVSGDNYSIYNINGEKIAAELITSGITPIDLSGFASGVYFVVITNDNQVYREKVVKK